MVFKKYQLLLLLLLWLFFKWCPASLIGGIQVETKPRHHDNTLCGKDVGHQVLPNNGGYFIYAYYFSRGQFEITVKKVK